MKRVLSALALSLALIVPAAAGEVSVSLDVPAELGTTTFLGNQTIRALSGGYTLRFDGPAQGMGSRVGISGLALLEDGGFLFTTDAPFEIAGTVFEPRDVVRYLGGSYTLYLDGAAIGLDAAAHIDALARTGDGALAVSFDRPEMIPGTVFEPADVAKVDGGALSMLFDASDHGLDEGANVVGYDRTPSGNHVLVFDTPVTTVTGTFLPGEVVEVDPVGFSVLFAEPGLPGYAGFSAVSLPGSPGAVDRLLVGRTGAALELSWQPSCSAEGNDYSIYEGQLGNYTSHVPVGCGTSGATAATVLPDTGDRYYLVVPKNGMYEGSYGTSSSGDERPALIGACETLQLVRECP